MTQAFNLSQFANKLNSSGQTDNTGLQNSSLTVAAGTGLSGGGVISLGGSATLNLANTAVTAGSYTNPVISIDAQGRITSATSGSGGLTGIFAQEFTSSGTFTVPLGVTAVKVTVIGGGGGSSGYGTNGGTGGTSSFGSYVTSSGGTGGIWANNDGVGGSAGGTANSAFSRIGGSGNGGYGGVVGVGSSFKLAGAIGYTGLGAVDLGTANGTVPPTTSYGCGAAGGTNNGSWAGGGAALAIGFVTGLTAGGTVTVTVGAAGTAAGGSNYQGSAGRGGYVLVEW